MISMLLSTSGRSPLQAMFVYVGNQYLLVIKRNTSLIVMHVYIKIIVLV